ncbi:MAG: hypothetical protein HQL51_01840 [Magnetococcales bacterium]|nr:hypothetical protein [Magnetococcales bacterium]
MRVGAKKTARVAAVLVCGMISGAWAAEAPKEAKEDPARFLKKKEAYVLGLQKELVCTQKAENPKALHDCKEVRQQEIKAYKDREKEARLVEKKQKVEQQLQQLGGTTKPTAAPAAPAPAPAPAKPGAAPARP